MSRGSRCHMPYGLYAGPEIHEASGQERHLPRVLWYGKIIFLGEGLKARGARAMDGSFPVWR